MQQLIALVVHLGHEAQTYFVPGLPQCFYDTNKTVRQLPHRGCYIRGPNPDACAHLTRESCGHMCQDAGFPLAGVEASHECTCGFKIERPTEIAPAEDCNESCTGSRNETCGGQYRLWAFNASSVGPVPPQPSPVPPDNSWRPIYHVPTNNPKGYVGDANGLMYRDGLFHMFWQADITEGLWWGHAVSPDYVFWHTLPWNESIGPGALSGGATKMPGGQVVAIFGDRVTGGTRSASPANISDPFLEKWHITHAVTGPLGSDMEIVATCGPYQTEIPYGEICLFVSKDNLNSFEFQSAPKQLRKGVLHRFKWSRCTKLPQYCGGHTNPCDPGMFSLPGTNVTVIYGMQKTCECSGREFYALGQLDHEHDFTLLDPISDYSNNLFDGGEQYAHMSVEDPRSTAEHPYGRRIMTGAIIEGDRDPSSCSKSGFPWTKERGWFGVLTLPRVLTLGNITLDNGHTDYYLNSAPLSELSSLRIEHILNYSCVLIAGSPIIMPPGNINSRSIEVMTKFKFPLWSSYGWDIGVRVLSGRTEYTRVGIRDATWMDKIDLWDEVNGDLAQYSSNSAEACQKLCENTARCKAWTYTNIGFPGLCRMKEHAQRTLLVVGGSPGCFLPNFGNWSGAESISGIFPQKHVKFAQLYIDRSESCKGPKCQNYARFGYAQLVRILPTDESLDIHIFVDRSVVEAFAQNGRATVSARVYPMNEESGEIGLYNMGKINTSVEMQAWVLKNATWNISEQLI